MKPILYDVCCGAGVGADGYQQKFEIFGIDHKMQEEYPYNFIAIDAIKFLQLMIDNKVFKLPNAIHASFPCQAHTRAKHIRKAQKSKISSVDILKEGLNLLRQVNIPWICENVNGAPMEPNDNEYSITLCGSMFGLQVQRHRVFLSNIPLMIPGKCNHKSFEIDPATGKPRPWGVYHSPDDSIPKGGRTCRDKYHAQECMGVERDISWKGLREGIPPAYTAWISHQLYKSC